MPKQRKSQPRRVARRRNAPIARPARGQHPPRQKPTQRGRVGTSSLAMNRTTREPTFSYRQHTTRGTVVRMSGREFITPLSVTASSDVVNGLLLQRENLCIPPNTRLQQQANLWQRWHPLKWTYHYAPSVGSNTPGSFVIANDPDPLTLWSAGAGNIPRAVTLDGSSHQQVWAPSAATSPSCGNYTDLWIRPATTLIDAEDRLVAAGQLVIVTSAPTGLAVNTVLGQIELDYEVDFFLPRLEFGDSGDSYTFSPDPSSIASFLPADASAGVKVVGSIVAAMQGAAYKIPAAKIAEAIKLAVPWPLSFGAGSVPSSIPGAPAVATPGYGLPNGQYKLRVEALWITALLDATLPPYVESITQSAVVNTNSEDTCGFGSSTNYLALVGNTVLEAGSSFSAPDGTACASMATCTVSFDVIGEHGYRDISLAKNLAVNAAPDYLVFTLSLNPIDFYQVFSTSFGAVTRPQRAVHQTELKSESKLMSISSSSSSSSGFRAPRIVPDDDEDYLSPSAPRYAPTPSSVPGGSNYVPSAPIKIPSRK